MSFVEGQYVSDREEKPWLYDIYDFEKIQEELRKRGFDQKISEIIREGFKDDWDLKEIEKKLGKAGFVRELQEIGTLFRSSKKTRDENN